MPLLRVEDCDDAAFALIAPLLRAEDQEEWRLFAGGTPAHLIRDGYRLPVGAGALTRIGYNTVDGAPLVVWGVSPYQSQPNIKPKHNAPGWVWLVATDVAKLHAQTIHHHLKREFHEGICKMYPKLITASWVGNTEHHKWLRWLGFKPAFVSMPMGVMGARFLPFTYTPHTKR